MASFGPQASTAHYLSKTRPPASRHKTFPPDSLQRKLMSTTLQAPFEKQVIEFGVADKTVADLRKRYGDLKITDVKDTKGYKIVQEAIADVKSVRVGVEKSRVSMKESALEYGRRVDAEAKRVTALLAAIEQPLVAEKKRIDDEKAAAKRAAEEAEKARIAAEIEAERKADQERIEAEQKAERERLAAQHAEMERERQKLAAERAALEAERARERERQESEAAKIREANRKAQAEIDAKNAEIAAAQAAEAARIAEQRREVERLEQQRLAALRAEREAEEKAKREREAAEAKRLEEIEQAKKLEAMKPDREKAATMAKTLSGIGWPSASTDGGNECFSDAISILQDCITLLDRFAKGIQ